MRRLFAWLAGAAGGLAAYRAAKRRASEPAPAVEVDPAEELRSKLAQAREAEPEAPASEPEAEPPLDADARRRAVHEGARATLDEMRGDS